MAEIEWISIVYVSESATAGILTYRTVKRRVVVAHDIANTPIGSAMRLFGHVISVNALACCNNRFSICRAIIGGAGHLVGVEERAVLCCSIGKGRFKKARGGLVTEKEKCEQYPTGSRIRRTATVKRDSLLSYSRPPFLSDQPLQQ